MSLTHSPSPDDSSSAINTLYCDDDAGEAVLFDSDYWISDRDSQSSSIFIYSPQSDESSFTRLIDSESHFLPLSDYLQRCRDRSIDVTARQDSINWILKVHAYYHFRPVTALLSVNYFDRFLSSHSFPANGWPFQLLSVACLSLAAKMEELHVPPLVDLQILEPGILFEPKTVQRMEIYVMTKLNWRLRSVSPFDYLNYFISKLSSSSCLKPDNFTRVFTAASSLILRTTRAIDFLDFAPSTIAAAAVLCAAGKSFVIPAADGQLFHERVNIEMVRSCHQLMQENLIDTCPSAQIKDTTAEPPVAPPSPVGVLDAAACGSCDTRSENLRSTSQAEASSPQAKRPRSSASDVQQP